MRTLFAELIALLDDLSVATTPVAADLVPHEHWLPPGASLPFVGLKNSGATWEDRPCQISEGEVLVTVIASVRMEEAANAEAMAGTTGTWAIVDAATAVLFAGAAECSRMQGWSVAKDHQDAVIKTDSGQWIVQSQRTIIFTVQRPTP